MTMLFEIDDTKLCVLYQRAWRESRGMGVNPRNYPYLDKAISIYAREHGCSYDEAWLFAKTGRKIGRMAD